MLYRKLRNQWLLMTILVMLMYSGSFLFKKNHQLDVYYNVRTTERTSIAPLSSLAPLKHVTKSLTELGKMDDINKYVLLLNKIPKCGAEVLIFLLQKLQGQNNYRHRRLKKDSSPRMSRIQQEEFVDVLYNVMRDEAIPLSFDKHIYFVNFTIFDKQSPTYINLIREPTDKIISRSIYNKLKDNDDLVHCVIQGKTNCSDKQLDTKDLTVPYFCGHDANCLSNDDWALQMAKNNVEKYYPVVGVLEELNATLQVLETKIPFFFKGVQNYYRTNLMDKFSRNDRPQPRPETRKNLKRALAKEYEFYNWIKRRLFSQLRTTR